MFSSIIVGAVVAANLVGGSVSETHDTSVLKQSTAEYYAQDPAVAEALAYASSSERKATNRSSQESATETELARLVDRALWSSSTAPTPQQSISRKSIPLDVKVDLLRLASGQRPRSPEALQDKTPDLAAALTPQDIELTLSSTRESVVNGVKCRGYRGSVTKFPSYLWEHYFDVCYDGSSVLWEQDRWAMSTHRHSTWKDRGLSSFPDVNYGSYNAISKAQGKMEFCVFQVGCLRETYPTIWITAHANGTATFEKMKNG